jgi:putative transposase
MSWSTAAGLAYLGRRRSCAAELGKAQRKMSRHRRARGQGASHSYLRARRQAAKWPKKGTGQTRHD